jgi:glucose-1-phosphate thymidylyltransferase
MKGVILAGGTGTRLLPLTHATNKHLLTVGDRPMIGFALGSLAEAGIREVLIVTDPRHAGAFASALGDGSRWGVRRLEMAWQPNAGGIADALRYAEGFAAGGRVCVVLGDNIFERSLERHVGAFERQRSGARFLLKKVVDPRRFGVARFEGPPPRGSRRARLTGIVEKPERPPSRFVVTGAYCYDAGVFGMCRGLHPSARGELEITDVNNAYIARGDAEYGLVDGWWTDAGTHRTLTRAARLVASRSGRRGAVRRAERRAGHRVRRGGRWA